MDDTQEIKFNPQNDGFISAAEDVVSRLEEKIRSLEQRVEELEASSGAISISSEAFINAICGEGEPVPGCPHLVTVPCATSAGDITL